jgi:hypothetical protein
LHEGDTLPTPCTIVIQHFFNNIADPNRIRYPIRLLGSLSRATVSKTKPSRKPGLDGREEIGNSAGAGENSRGISATCRDPIFTETTPSSIVGYF